MTFERKSSMTSGLGKGLYEIANRKKEIINKAEVERYNQTCTVLMFLSIILCI